MTNPRLGSILEKMLNPNAPGYPRLEPLQAGEEYGE